MITLLILVLSQPVFGPMEPVYYDGDSLDAGLGSAPCLVDWNDNGLIDILVGTRAPYLPLLPYAAGGIYYLPNTGTPEIPVFETLGILEADGWPITHST